MIVKEMGMCLMSLGFIGVMEVMMREEKRVYASLSISCEIMNAFYPAPASCDQIFPKI